MNQKENAMTTMSNGQVRKSLASQIDRLDTMLDGLSDGLTEMVVSAVKQAAEVAVKEAVGSVLSEVLTNPDLQSRLPGAVQAPTREPTANRVSLRQRLGQVCSWIGQRIMSLCGACGEQVRAFEPAISYGCERMVDRCKSLVNRAGSGASAAWQRLQIVRTLKYQLLTALAIGAVCGTILFFAGPSVAAVAGAIGGFGTSCAVQMGIWLRRIMAFPVELAEPL